MLEWIPYLRRLFLDVDARFIQTWTDQARAKLPHSLVDLGWFKGKAGLLRLGSPALAKMAFGLTEGR